MLEDPNDQFFYLCRYCSNPVQIQKNENPTCSRCGHAAHLSNPKSAESTVIYSLTALILFIPANLLPFMTIELYGNRNSSTIYEGVSTLIKDGSWAIGLVVFFASLVIPLLKLLTLFYLSLTAHHYQYSKFKTQLFQVVEALGRWSMLDIFLLAVLVAIMKLRSSTAIKPEIGSLLFAGVVIFTMLASASFDPQLLWKEKT